MADYKYTIDVINEVVSSDKPSGLGDSISTRNNESLVNALDFAKKGIGNTIVIQAVKQASNFAISNYGNLTGDYVTQQNVQAGIQIASIGVMACNWPIGTLAAAATLAVSISQKEIELSKKNYQYSQLRERTGVIDYSGGRL